MIDGPLIAGLVCGAGVACAGLWMLWGRRLYPDDRAGAEATAESRPVGPIRSRFTEPTRLAIGVALLLLGYHIGAWSAPEDWFGVKVPRERWWMLLGGIAIAIGGSMTIDRLDRRAEAED